jgi:hypothetical protein
MFPRSPRSALTGGVARLRSRLPRSGPLRWTLLGVIAATVGSPLAIGAALAQKNNKDVRIPLAAGERNPKKGVLTEATRIVARTKGHAFKVSNAAGNGGSALLTCVTPAGGADRPPCLQAENEKTGKAFGFRFNGEIGGVFQIGNDIDQQFPSARPFVTNATGVATGLNADRLDGLHAQDIIDSAVERSSVQVGAQGPQGPQGAQGTRGPQGLQGPNGAAGTPLEAAKSTPENATYANQRLELLPARALNSTEPTAVGHGVDLVGDPAIILDPGTYIVQTTFRAIDLGSTNDATDDRYAVASVFLGTVLQTTLITADVPADAPNGAQAADTTVVTVPTGPSLGLDVRGVVRSSGGNLANTLVGGGVTVVVTEVNPLS